MIIMEMNDETRFTIAYVGVCYILVLLFPDIYTHIGIGLFMIGLYLFFMNLYIKYLKKSGKSQNNSKNKND